MNRLVVIANECKTFNVITTTDVNDYIIKPLTEKKQCSLISLLKQDHQVIPHPLLELTYSQCVIEKATTFVSHAWRYKFSELIESLNEPHQLLENNSLILNHKSFWLDLCVNDQWNAPNLPYKWWSSTFLNAIGDIGHTSLVLLPWDEPIPLTRAWCLYEILSTRLTSSKLSILLSPTQRSAFYIKLSTDYDSIITSLSCIGIIKIFETLFLIYFTDIYYIYRC